MQFKKRTKLILLFVVLFLSIGITASQARPPKDTTAPYLYITSHKHGQTVSGEITIKVNAWDDQSGIREVILWVDHGYISKADTSKPYSFKINTLYLYEGPHAITVLAFDNAEPEENVARRDFILVVKNGQLGYPYVRFDQIKNNDHVPSNKWFGFGIDVTCDGCVIERIRFRVLENGKAIKTKNWYPNKAHAYWLFQYHFSGVKGKFQFEAKAWSVCKKTDIKTITVYSD